MCLHVDTSRKPPKTKKTLYKIITLSISGHLVTRFWSAKIKPGWFKPKNQINFGRKLKNEEVIREGAIHAYISSISAKKAKSRVKYILQDDYIIKCIGYPKDFIAYGSNEDICYKKIFVPKSEIDRVKKLVAKINDNVIN